jgi:hypothetical protein
VIAGYAAVLGPTVAVIDERGDVHASMSKTGVKGATRN